MQLFSRVCLHPTIWCQIQWYSSADAQSCPLWLTLQQQAKKEFLVETLGYVCKLERQLKLRRSASSASTLVCWGSGPWRRSCWNWAKQGLPWASDWRNGAVLCLWSAKARRVWACLKLQQCTTQHYSKPTVIRDVCRDEFYRLGCTTTWRYEAEQNTWRCCQTKASYL